MSTSSDFTDPSDADIEVSYTSKYNFRKIKLNWIIPDLEFTFKNMKVIESPRFPSTKKEKVKWYIRIEPTELKKNNADKFRMFLKHTGNSDKAIKAYIFFYDSHRKMQGFACNTGKVMKELSPWAMTGDELYKASLNSEELLPKTMTVICEITLVDSGRNVAKQSMKAPLKSEGIMKQMECFFDDQGFKDVKFIVEEKEFSAHKTILALRSPVFAAMFKSKMSEELSSVVEIKDISSTIFQLMLRFIYTDKVDDLEESALELFYVAEKYQLEGLKKLCIISLYDNMSLESVVKIFELADTFSIPKLKNKAAEFLASCLKAGEESEEFADLLETRPHLAAEVVKLQKEIDNENETYEDLSHDMKYELRS